MFNCFLCECQFELSSHLLIHLNIFHDPKSISKFNCKHPNCFRTFGSLDLFKKHINSHSFNYVQNNITITQDIDNHSPILTQNITTKTLTSNSNTQYVNSEKIDTYVFSHESLKNKIQKNAIILVSKWYSNGAIPRNMVQSLLDDVENFNASILQDITDKIINNPNSTDTVKNLSLILNALKNLSTPFDNLITEYISDYKL